MKKNLLQDLSASSLQLLLNYFTGFIIFFITSRYLTKLEFGELNWSIAVIVFATVILSLRLEQIIVRRVAAGEDASQLLTIFTFHVVAGGILFYSALLCSSFLFPGFFDKHNLLLTLSISQLLSFFSSPFKQLANGKEQFGALAIMSVTANVIRTILLLYYIVFSELDIRTVLIIYIVSSLAELVVSFLIVRFRMKIAFNTHWKFQEYILLLRESAPQIGTVFFNAAIARMDWILIGFFTTPVVVAEYSFAYRVFELCPLPLLIISPILLSRFAKFFSGKNEKALEGKKAELDFLVRVQLVTACLIALVINLTWIPLAGAISGDKYGLVNRNVFMILSLCLPLQFIINILWTIHFSLNHLAFIFRITAITCLVMLVGDVLLIPGYGALGAAIGYFVALTTEYIQYIARSTLPVLKTSWISLLTSMTAAASSGILVIYFFEATWIKLSAGIVVFALLLLITGQIKLRDTHFVKQLLKSKYRN